MWKLSVGIRLGRLKLFKDLDLGISQKNLWVIWHCMSRRNWKPHLDYRTSFFYFNLFIFFLFKLFELVLNIFHLTISLREFLLVVIKKMKMDFESAVVHFLL